MFDFIRGSKVATAAEISSAVTAWDAFLSDSLSQLEIKVRSVETGTALVGSSIYFSMDFLNGIPLLRASLLATLYSPLCDAVKRGRIDDKDLAWTAVFFTRHGAAQLDDGGWRYLKEEGWHDGYARKGLEETCEALREVSSRYAKRFDILWRKTELAELRLEKEDLEARIREAEEELEDAEQGRA